MPLVLAMGPLARTGEAAQDWRGWRGPAGSGVVEGRALATTWGPGASNVRWRTAVPGKGLSSPIVVGERVLVTTAYEAVESRRVLDLAGLTLVALAGALLLARAAHRTRDVDPDLGGLLARGAAGALVLGQGTFVLAGVASLTNHFEWMQGGGALPPWRLALGVLGVSVLVVWLRAVRAGGARGARASAAYAALAAAGVALVHRGTPRATFFVVAALGFLALVCLRGAASAHAARSTTSATAELAGAAIRTATLLGLALAAAAALRPELFWSESTAQHVWRRSSLAALLALAGAAGLWPRATRASRVGAALLVAAGLAALVWMPGNELDQPPPLARRLSVLAPVALALACLRLRPRSPGRSGLLTAAASLALVALGAWVFLRANLWQPRVRTDQALVCLDRETGAIRWQRVLFHSAAEHLDTFRTSHASPTPASDGERVVAHFGTGTACVDLDGRVLWSHAHPGYVSTSIYGAGSSPVLAGGRAYVLQERELDHELRPSFLAAYELATGALVWRVEPREACASYGTPLLLPPEAPTELVTATWRGVASYELATGARRWFRPLPIEEVVTSPVADATMLCVGGGSIVGATAGFRLAGEEGGPPVGCWQTRRGTPECSSPVLHEGRLYTVTEGGVLSAFDAASGESLWRGRLEGGSYYASLLVAGGLLYASNAEGVTSVVRAGERFERVAVNELGEGLFASPAAADGQLFLRGLESVVRIDPGPGTVRGRSEDEAGAARH